MIPQAINPQTLELSALMIGPLLGIDPTFLTKIAQGNVGFFLFLGLIVLLNFPFDGQAVTIPPRTKGHAAPHHAVIAVQEIL